MTDPQIVPMGNKLQHERMLADGRYQVDVVCDNCGHEQVAWIPKKLSVRAALVNCFCLLCELRSLSRKIERPHAAI